MYISFFGITCHPPRRGLMGSNPAESPVKFFPQTHSESTEYTVVYTRRCKGKIKSIVYHPTQECHQPINIAEPAAT